MTVWRLKRRGGAARNIALAAAVTVVWLAISAGVIWVRVNEIPAVDPRIAEYRLDNGPADEQLVDAIEQRLRAAMGGYSEPAGLFYFTWIYEAALTAKAQGNNRPLEENLSETAQRAWQDFLGEHPELTLAEQLQQYKSHLEANRGRLEELHGAISFAVAEFDQYNRAAPRPLWRGAEDLISYWAEALLWLGTKDALEQGDIPESWRHLKGRLTLERLRETLCPDRYQSSAVQDVDYWLTYATPDQDTLRDMLAFMKSELALPAGLDRIHEAEWMESIEQVESMRVAFAWWERERTRRLTNLWYAWRACQLTAARRWYESGRQGNVDVEALWRRQTGLESRPQFEQWVDNTLVPSEAGRNSFGVSLFLSSRNPATQKWLEDRLYVHWTDERIQMVREREMMILKLAAMVWQLEHGRMPEDVQEMAELLDGVSQGEWTDRMPLLENSDYSLLPAAGGAMLVTSRYGFDEALVVPVLSKQEE
jgi:hypothetical protein